MAPAKAPWPPIVWTTVEQRNRGSSFPPRQEIAALHNGGKESIGPRPVPDDRIDEAGDKETVNQVTHKAPSANHRARRNRGAGVRETQIGIAVRQESDPRCLVRWPARRKEKPVQPIQQFSWRT